MPASSWCLAGSRSWPPRSSCCLRPGTKTRPARAIYLSHPEPRQPHRRAARGVTNLAEPAARDHRPPSAHSPRPGGLSKVQAGCLLASLADGRMPPSPRPLMGLMTGWEPTRPRSRSCPAWVFWVAVVLTSPLRTRKYPRAAQTQSGARQHKQMDFLRGGMAAWTSWTGCWTATRRSAGR